MILVLFYVAIALGFIPFILLIFNKRVFNIKEPLVVFSWLMIIGSLYELIGTAWLQIDTKYWFQLYSLLEFLALYYYFSYKSDYKNKNIFRFFLILFVLVYVTSFFNWSESNSLFRKAITKLVTTSFVFVAFGLWVKKKFEKKIIFNLFNTSDFYFVSGIIIYFASTFITFLSANYIYYNTSSNLNDYWIIIIYANIVFRILISISVWKTKHS